MSQSKEKNNLYTTGEIAKLCGVSVRTVQYYDDRGILIPSTLSEGGRRLYSEEDLGRMRIICFLREAGLPINSISALLHEEGTAVLKTLFFLCHDLSGNLLNMANDGAPPEALSGSSPRRHSQGRPFQICFLS